METLENIDINTLPQLLVDSGLDSIVQTQVGVTRNTQKDRLEIVGSSQKILLDDQGGLDRVRGGDIGFLFGILARSSGMPGDFSATDLLKSLKFAQAVFSEVDFTQQFNPNVILQKLVSLEDRSIPVSYGSTSGINFAEVLETAICSEAVREKGVQSSVVFDFEGADSPQSRQIFEASMRALPVRLRERALNFITQVDGALINSRLKATKELVAQLPDLPQIEFIDGIEVFRALGEDFTIAQLLLMAKIAGQNPKLFINSEKGVVTPISIARKAQKLKEPFKYLRGGVVGFIDRGFKPAGFSYYAREARIGMKPGVVVTPFKLTDKANIYKILAPTAALFSAERNQGIILAPITRQRIQTRIIEGVGENLDPIALGILAADQPLSFQKLVRAFREVCRVLTVDEAIEKGEVDSRFFIEDFFNLKEEYE